MRPAVHQLLQSLGQGVLLGRSVLGRMDAPLPEDRGAVEAMARGLNEALSTLHVQAEGRAEGEGDGRIH